MSKMWHEDSMVSQPIANGQRVHKRLLDNLSYARTFAAMAAG